MIHRQTFADAVRTLADAGDLPARTWQQHRLGNPRGAETLVQMRQPADRPSVFLDYFEAWRERDTDLFRAQSALEALIADDPAHLLAHALLEQFAAARQDDWGRLRHRTAREEFDPSSHPTKPVHHTGAADRPVARGTASLQERVPERLTGEEGRLLLQSPVITETIADLFREQGHPRIAGAMYKQLLLTDNNPGIREKLAAVTRQLPSPQRPSPDERTE